MHNIKEKFFKKNFKYITILVLYVIFFSIYIYRVLGNIMDSDIAGEMIIGQELSNNHEWILGRSVYYNTEIRLFDIQLLTAPLLLIIYDWKLATVVANGIFMVAFIITTYIALLLIQGSEKKREIAFIGALAVCLPFSYNYYYIGLGCGYYISKFLLEMSIIVSYVGWITFKQRVFIIFTSVLAFVAGLKSIRYLLILFIPLFIAAVISLWVYYRDEKIEDLKWNIISCDEKFKSLIVTMFLCIINLCGYLCNTKILSRYYNFASYSEIQFGSFSEKGILSRVSQLIDGWFEVMGYNPDVTVFSIRGIVNVLIVLAVIAYVYCCYYLGKNFKKLTYVEQIIFVFVNATIIFNTYIFAVTDVFTPRYYAPICIFTVLNIAIYLKQTGLHVKNMVPRIGISILVVGYLLLSSICTMQTTLGLDAISTREKVVAFLRENGYHFGYAMYWNGNVLSGMTNGELEIANLKDPNTMEGFLWNSCTKYYQRDYCKDKTFLLLSKEENEWYADCETIKGGMLVYDDENYVIYSYQNSETLYSFASK